MSQPLFSIAIPTFNSGRYVVECVGSALEQSYPNIEVVVDDNASSDRTCSEIRKSFGSNPKLKIFENGEDLNIPNGWNRAYTHCNGEYFLLLHSDNLLHPDYVRNVLASMQQHSAEVAYSDCHYFEENTPKDLFAEFNEMPTDRLAPGNRAVEYVFRFERMIPTSSTTIRRACLNGALPYDPQYRWDPDMELLVRLSKTFGVLRLRASLAAIRTHEGQARGWKDPLFSQQYRELLFLQHREGRTEPYQFLLEWAASNQDLVRRLSVLKAPPPSFLKYTLRWYRSELQVFKYFLVNLLRKTKLLIRTFFQWCIQ